MQGISEGLLHTIYTMICFQKRENILFKDFLLCILLSFSMLQNVNFGELQRTDPQPSTNAMPLQYYIHNLVLHTIIIK